MRLSEATEKQFDDLAQKQRGAPESAMLKVQFAQISQLYGWACEHTGDLTHRMSQRPKFFKGGHQWVEEKVRKLLNQIDPPWIFLDEVDKQIKNNTNYAIKSGTGSMDSKAWKLINPKEERDWMTAKKVLKGLGKQYASQHAKLKTYNYVQKQARDAAVNLGLWKFSNCVKNLNNLNNVLKKGRAAWEQAALENLE